MSDLHDYYRVLGVDRDATAGQIRRAYRRLAKEHHPDRGGDPQVFRVLQRAYHVLGDETRRAAYDDSYVDGAAVLDEIRGILCQYVVFPSEAAAVAVTLYCAATHAVSRLEFATRLVIKSPVKRCGKSRLLDVISLLVSDPLVTSDMSAAALARSLDAFDPPTVILDEADATFSRSARGDERTEQLRGLLNSGFGRNRFYARYNPQTRAVEKIPTFAMAVLAGIGNLPDTIADRAVIITMRRRSDSEQICRYRTRRDGPRVRAAGERLGQWVVPRSRMIGDAEPALPEALSDRAQDAWESLTAVADAAGGDWPRLARSAAVELSSESEEGSLPVLLLADLRAVFADADRMSTEDVLTGLAKIDTSPWGDFRGRPLEAHGLARLLKVFGIAPRVMRVDGRLARGYDRADLAGEWERYLPPQGTPREGTRNNRNSVTPQVTGSPFRGVTDRSVTPRTGPPSDQARYGVTDVTDPPQEGDS
jgi:hypothetical protein